MNYLAQNIRYLRMEAGLSQADIAEMVCASAGCVSNWERGKNEPDLYTLIWFAKYYKRTLDELILTPLKEETDG